MTGEELNKGPEAEAVVAVPVDGAVAVAEDNVNANANNVTVGVYQQAVLANQCQPAPMDQGTATSPFSSDVVSVQTLAESTRPAKSWYITVTITASDQSMM